MPWSNKRGLEFSFAWLFALFVGAAIILLAIYGATRFIESEKILYDTRVAAELGAILSPLETNLESSKYYRIKLNDETRLNSICQTQGPLGEQSLSVSVQAGLGNKWAQLETGLPSSFQNKYVFMMSGMEGTELHTFILPFSMPYKIGSLIIAYTQAYCLVSPPPFVQEEIESLGLKNVNIVVNKNACPQESIVVCFENTQGCVVRITLEGDGEVGDVTYKFKTLPYYGPLIYAAMFSDQETYECNLMRLRKRAAGLARLYAAKADILSTEGCTSGLGPELYTYSVQLENEAISLRNLVSEADRINQRNERLTCRLF